MSFIVATNVVASQPPEYRLTGTPTASANYSFSYNPYLFDPSVQVEFAFS